MLKNYILISLRKIRKNFGLTFLNILGLSIGLSISFIIYTYFIYETEFDKHHLKRSKIFRLIWNYHPEGSESNYVVSRIQDELIVRLRDEYPEIDKVVNLKKIKGDSQVKFKSDVYSETDLFFTGPEVLDIFTFDIIKGDENNLLVNNFDLILSESKSKLYFKNENPIGKTLILETSKDTLLLTVKGVIKDFPVNSTIKFDFIAKINNTYNHYYKVLYSYETYLLLKDGTDYKKLEEKLPEDKYDYGTIMFSNYKLQPLDDIYFNSGYIKSYSKKIGNRTNVYILAIIAFIILLVSVNNFTLFSIFDTKSLIKEFAIRKSVGAALANIQVQQLIKAILYILITLILSLIITYFLIPFWNQNLEVNLLPILFQNIKIVIGFILITIFTIIILGMYGAYNARFLNKLVILNPAFVSLKTKHSFQKLLIVFQVFLFVAISSFSFVVRNQVSFALNKDIGYDKTNLLAIDFSSKELKSKYFAFMAEVKNLSFVECATGISHLIPNADFYKTHFPKFDDPSQNVVLNLLYVNEDFFKTINVNFADNQDSKMIPYKNKSYIINDIAAVELGLNLESGPPYHIIRNNTKDNSIERICKNFDIQSINHHPSPFAIRIRKSPLNYMLIKLAKNPPENALNQLEDIFVKNVSVKGKFNAIYINDHIENYYKKDRMFYKVSLLGTFIAILNAFLGLLNVSFLILKSKSKELLIRKVFGAREVSIFNWLTKDLLKLVVIANILAIPFSIFIIDKWLNNYAQHISLSAQIYIVVFAICVFIMLLISLLSIKFTYRKTIISELNKDS